MKKKYEHVVYSTAKFYLDGWYTLQELKDIIKSSEDTSKRLVHSMKEIELKDA